MLQQAVSVLNNLLDDGRQKALFLYASIKLSEINHSVCCLNIFIEVEVVQLLILYF